MEHWLEQVRGEPGNAEYWVCLLLSAVVGRDRNALREICALRRQIFNDAGLLLFQAIYSGYVQDNPSLQKLLPEMAPEGEPVSDCDLVMAFFAGCQLMIEGRLPEGRAQWEKAIRAFPDHGGGLEGIPQLEQLPALGMLFRRLEAGEPMAAAEDAFRWLGGAAQGDGPVFLAACDGHYWNRFGARFLEILRPHGSMHLHLADAVPGQLEQLMGRAGAGFSISSEETGEDGSARYYASMRFLRAAAIQERLDRDLVILDVDLETVRNLPRLLEQAARSDISYFDTGLLLPWLRHQAAFMYVRNNAAAVRFLEILSGILRGLIPEGRWFVDQAAMLRACQQIRQSADGADIGLLSYGEGWHFKDFFTSGGTPEEKRTYRIRSDGGTGGGV